MSSAENKYRFDIDGLRAIAVIIVVLFHANLAGFTGGFVGVDVFFVISGYLITGHLLNEVLESGDISFSRFYSKRFKRLLPAILALFLVLLCLWCFLFWGLLEESLKFFKSMQFSAWGGANFFFKKVSEGYFNEASDEMPLLHFWSLAVEEQFYFIWPIMLYFTAKMKFFNFKRKEIYLKRVMIFLCAIVATSFLFTIVLMQKKNINAAFYLMPARAWELGIGGLLVFFPNKQLSLKWANLISVLGGLLLLVSISTVEYFSFPGLGALLPTLGTALLIYSGQKSGNEISKILSNKFLVFFGTISYSWYLWHWPLLAMLKIYNFGEVAPLGERLSAVVISAGLAYVSLRYVERPFRFNKHFLLNDKKTIIIGVLSISIITAAALIIPKIQRQVLEKNSIRIEVGKRTAFLASCVDKLQNMGTEECIYSRKEKEGKRIRISMWGDSFSYSMFPALEQYVDEFGGKAFLYSNSGAPPISKNSDLQMVYSDYIRGKLDISDEVVAHILNSIKREPGVNHSVVLVAYWLRYMPIAHIRANQESACIGKVCKEKDSLKIMEESLKRSIEVLNDGGIHKILIIKPWAEFKYPIERCLNLKRKDCSTGLMSMNNYSENISNLLDRVSRHYPNVKTVSPLQYICNNKECPQVISSGNKIFPIVFDDAHPSVAGARYFGEKVEKEFNWMIE